MGENPSINSNSTCCVEESIDFTTYLVLNGSLFTKTVSPIFKSKVPVIFKVSSEYVNLLKV